MSHQAPRRAECRHLAHLVEVRDRPGDPAARLTAGLTTYAGLTRHRHGHDAAPLHRGPHVTEAHERLHALIRDLLAEAAATGQVRADVPAGELAAYCLHALGAAGGCTSEMSVRRLVTATLAGLGPAA